MSQKNVEIVRALYEAFARRDGESPFSVYAPDIEWDMSRSAIPLPGEEAVYHGHAGVRRYARAWLEAWDSSTPHSNDWWMRETRWSHFSAGRRHGAKRAASRSTRRHGRRSGPSAMEKWSGCASTPSTPRALEAAG